MSDDDTQQRSLGTKIVIQVFAYSVGIAIFLTIDHLTGWIGIVH